MNTTLLQQLYKGELRLEEQYRPLLKENCEKRKALYKREEVLLEKLDSDMRREIERFIDELDLIGFMDMEDVYIQGMQTGARLTLELLGN